MDDIFGGIDPPTGKIPGPIWIDVKEKIEEWKPHTFDDCLYDDEEECNYSITNNEKRGWNTDSGCPGYGIPLGLAKWICEIINESGKECPYENKGWSWVKKK